MLVFLCVCVFLTFNCSRKYTPLTILTLMTGVWEASSLQFLGQGRQRGAPQAQINQSHTYFICVMNK